MHMHGSDLLHSLPLIIIQIFIGAATIIVVRVEIIQLDGLTLAGAPPTKTAFVSDSRGATTGFCHVLACVEYSTGCITSSFSQTTDYDRQLFMIQ